MPEQTKQKMSRAEAKQELARLSIKAAETIIELRTIVTVLADLLREEDEAPHE